MSRVVFLMRAAALPATLAWMVGTATLFVVACWSTASDAHARGAAQLGVASPQTTLGTILFLLLAYGFGAALVILPTCLLSVVPLGLFPPAWPGWRPTPAAVLGAGSGPVAMYVWAAGYRGEWFVPNPFDSAHVGLAAVAALVGTTFGFLFARAVRRAGH